MRRKAILVLAAVFPLFTVSSSAFAGYLYGTPGNDIYRIDPTDWSLTVLYDDSYLEIRGGLTYIHERTVGDYIDWADLGAFAESWLDDGCLDANGWCGGADINRDEDVDFVDFAWLAQYWEDTPPVPGQASDPDPNDTATDVSITADLSWTTGSDAAAHGVYFGINPTPDANDFQGYQTSTTFDPGLMIGCNTYYWRVDEVGLGGTTTGELWSFTTAPAPGQARYPSPADSETIDGYLYLENIWTTLMFTAGDGSITSWREAFFSENLALVEARDASVSLGAPPFPINYPTRYYVGFPLVPPYTESLERGMTYYWCVDERDGNMNLWQGPTWSFTVRLAEASAPRPPDGQRFVSTTPVLRWRRGAISDFPAPHEHDIYFGTSFDDLNNATTSSLEYRGTQPFGDEDWEPVADGGLPPLDYETDYYWRIDEAHGRPPIPPYAPELLVKGDVWEFTTEPAPVPGQGSNPIPVDMAIDVNISPCLSWTAGPNTTSHDVYFGTISPGDFQGNQKTTTFCPPNSLEYNTTYYWRIDEKNAYNTTTGEVWSFTTMPDPNLIGWWKFNETSGNIAYDSSGNENHGQLVDGIGNGLVWVPAQGALNFDGSNNKSRVLIPTEGMKTTAGTIAIWANLAEPQIRGGGRNGSAYFFGCDNRWNNKILLYMDNSNTKLDIKVGNRSNKNIITLHTETWYHIALTWNAGTYAIYVNGLKLDTGSYGGLTSLSSTADIGNNGSSSTQSFHGLMGDVQLYDISLSAAEIQQLYQDGAN